MQHDRLVWIDLETSGLDTQRCQLLEIGLVVTEADLIAVASWAGYGFINYGGYGEAGALKMHLRTGLLEEIEQARIGRWPGGEETRPLVGDHDQLCKAALDFILKHAGMGTSPMCGSTVGSYDRPIIRRLMPALDAAFSYRCVDVSSIKELVKRWALPQRPVAEKGAAEHRSLADIRASIAELQWYRENVFVQPL